MRKFKIILLPIAFLFLFSCVYEDGPFISFSSAKARIVNKWKYSKVEVNSVDITEEFKNQYLEFKNNGDAIYFISVDTIYYGAWTLSEDRKSIKVIMDDSGNTWNEDYNILKLKGDEMWIEDSFGVAPKRYELTSN